VRLLIATDAWHPQVNGVVRSLEQMVRRTPSHGFEAAVLSPSEFPSMPLPGYPEIRLACPVPGRLASRWDEAAPTHVHIATEGPVGFAVRRRCLALGLPFTTSYHTRFPEYLAARAPVPEAWSYAYLRRFHGAGRGTMVSTASLQGELEGRGFGRLMRWTRGVDTDLFRPAAPGTPEPADLAGLPRPFFLFVGRLAIEKNVAAFLALDLPGTKVVIGARRPLPRHPHRRGSRRPLRRLRRVRVPEHDRYVRHRALGGDGLRPAGGRLPRHRPPRRDRLRRSRRPRP
jgi:glycosyltransferase involved in cell wall biosynthesis